MGTLLPGPIFVIKPSLFNFYLLYLPFWFFLTWYFTCFCFLLATIFVVIVGRLLSRVGYFFSSCFLLQLNLSSFSFTGMKENSYVNVFISQQAFYPTRPLRVVENTVETQPFRSVFPQQLMKLSIYPVSSDHLTS